MKPVTQAFRQMLTYGVLGAIVYQYVPEAACQFLVKTLTVNAPHGVGF
jgi:hypothetical protein